METLEWYAVLKERGEWEDYVREQQLLRPLFEQQRRERVEFLRAASAPLDEALKRAGVNVSDGVAELVNQEGCNYQHALPILLEHLKRDYPPEIHEEIGRALAVREAEFAWEELLRIFEIDPPTHDSVTTSGRKTGVAIALMAIATAFKEHVPELFPLLRDRTRHGLERVYLLPAIEKSRSGDAGILLEELKGDPELKSFIAAIRSRDRARLRRKERKTSN